MWSVATHFPWSVCVVDTLLSPAKTAGPIVWAMDLWGPGNHFSGDILDPLLERALLRDILGTPRLDHSKHDGAWYAQRYSQRISSDAATHFHYFSNLMDCSLIIVKRGVTVLHSTTKLWFYASMNAGLPLPNLGDLPQKPVMYNVAANNNALNKLSKSANDVGFPNIVERPSSVSLANWTANITTHLMASFPWQHG